MFVDIENNHGLKRDISTKAVVQSDKTKYNAYMSRFQQLNKVESLEKEVKELKELLTQLVGKNV